MCTTTAPARLSLPVGTRAPARARAFVQEATCDAHGGRMLQGAQLLVSDLVTNAVRDGAGPVTVQVECDAAAVVVRVHDEGPLRPLLLRHHPVMGLRELAVRGLLLVDVVSDAWGVEPAEYGGAVWFRLHPGTPVPA